MRRRPRFRSRALAFAEAIRSRVGVRRGGRPASLLLALRRQPRALVRERILARERLRVEQRTPLVTVHLDRGAWPSRGRRPAGRRSTPLGRRSAAVRRRGPAARSERPTDRLLLVHGRDSTRASEPTILDRRVERSEGDELFVRRLEPRFGPAPPARAGDVEPQSRPPRLSLRRSEGEGPSDREPAEPPAPGPGAAIADPRAAGPVERHGAGVDVAQLTDQVIAAIDRRIVAQRERRGGR